MLWGEPGEGELDVRVERFKKLREQYLRKDQSNQEPNTGSTGNQDAEIERTDDQLQEDQSERMSGAVTTSEQVCVNCMLVNVCITMLTLSHDRGRWKPGMRCKGI